MSSTRRASKRDRIQRRAENDAMRTARRDSLAVLLSRAQRGVPLTADEAALLRAAVEAEIREGDAARQAERGQQRAADRERERATAAEAAIVEAEQRAERVGATLARVRVLARRMGAGSPQGAAAVYADRIEQALDDNPDAFTDQQAAAQSAFAEVAFAEAAEHVDQHLAEAALDRVRALAADMRTWCSPHGIATQYADDIERALAEQPRAAVDVAPGVAVIRDRAAEQRAAQAEELQRIAHETSNTAERARADAEQRAKKAEKTLAATEARSMHWARKADRYRAAWHSARRRARVHAQHVERLKQSNHRWYSNATEQRRHTERAEHRAGRYRLAWYAARRDRRADRAAMAAELSTVQAADRIRRYVEAAYSADISEGVRDDLRRLLDGQPPEYAPWNPRPEVITDRATIRDTLAEPEPTKACPCNGVCHECDDSPCDDCTPEPKPQPPTEPTEAERLADTADTLQTIVNRVREAVGTTAPTPAEEQHR
ncbi:hypothetical protein ABZ690_21030 [Streptomyces sp. NPDC006967]|uniref:hypothetical protein n=1 Tax=Streptomyces sp. NPDC006967 TaxID=3156906 RepID=UPI0033FCC76C